MNGPKYVIVSLECGLCVIQAPAIRIRIFLNPQLFLSGFGFESSTRSGGSSIRIRNFLNPLSRMEIFEYAMNL